MMSHKNLGFVPGFFFLSQKMKEGELNVPFDYAWNEEHMG